LGVASKQLVNQSVISRRH